MQNRSRVLFWHEVLSTKIWWMEHTAFQSYKNIVADDVLAKRWPDENPIKSFYQETISVNYTDEYTLEERKGEVNIMYIDGPITRNDAACSFGSIRFKERFIDASKSGVLAHVIVINSPGGSASAIYDYKDAIEFAREKGQPVIAFIKGMGCSAAYAAAMMCDEIACYSEHDDVGSIGAMGALRIVKPGAVNSITQETTVEVYADVSPLKNNISRAAEQDDLQPLKDLVNKSGEDFVRMVEVYRPNSLPEQRTGDVYLAKDVIGTLVDKISDLDSCIADAVEMAQNNLRIQRQNNTFTQK